MKCKCGTELPIWGHDIIELTPDIHIKPAQLRPGSFIHRKINGVSQESFHVDIKPEEDLDIPPPFKSPKKPKSKK